MSYQLLACDLDGTLLDENLNISARVRQAVHAAQARGVQVTLATGRSLEASLPYAASLNIRVPLICYQGGLVAEPTSGQILRQVSLERDLAQDAVRLAHARGWHMVLYAGERMYLQEFRYPRSFYIDMLGVNLYLVDDLTSVLAQADNPEPVKFILVAEEKEADRIHDEISTHLHGRLLIVRSHRLFVEGNPLKANKGAALDWLADHLGIPQAQVMAIGDQENDVTMLAWAGLGVALGGASIKARSAADWVAPSLSSDGAAVAIERFVI